MQSQYHPAETVPAGIPPMDFVDSCSGCPNRVVCRCLQVTEATAVEAITRLELRTIKEVQRHTGAGTGCTCCHGELRELLEQNAPCVLPLAG